NECLQLTEASAGPESSKKSGSKPQTPLPPLKNLQGDSLRSEVMTLTYQDHSPRERSGLGTMKHTKPETQESSNGNISGPVTVFDIEPVTSSVPTEVKTNEQESKIDELTKLVQMLMDEKINSTQKIQEPRSVSSQPKSSKSVNSSKQSQDSKLNGKNLDLSKPVRPKPLQKPKLKCTDKSEITRKQSKASKHGHENQKSTKPKPQKTKALANFHLQGPFLQCPKVIYNLKE
ncbi:hypothetical protein Tco_1012272, partial [Tanacetum coccineum]